MSNRPVPLAPRHRRDWRTWWRRCTCGLPWPCPDRRLPVPVARARADRERGSGPPEPETVYLSRVAPRPYEIRRVVFGRRRRGLDPEQVYPYLDRVAAELDRLYREVAVAGGRADRVRDALGAWQTAHADCHRAQPVGTTTGRW